MRLKIAAAAGLLLLGFGLGFAAGRLGVKGPPSGAAELTLGKSFSLSFAEGAVIDAAALSRIAETEDVNPLNLVDRETLESLMKFMERNNLRIVPGVYTLNQTDQLAQVLDKLYFLQADA